MNGFRPVLIMVLLLGYVAGGIVFFTCAKHLQQIIRINRRIDSRLNNQNVWLDDTFREIFSKS